MFQIEVRTCKVLHRQDNSNRPYLKKSFTLKNTFLVSVSVCVCMTVWNQVGKVGHSVSFCLTHSLRLSAQKLQFSPHRECAHFSKNSKKKKIRKSRQKKIPIKTPLQTEDVKMSFIEMLVGIPQSRNRCNLILIKILRVHHLV